LPLYWNCFVIFWNSITNFIEKCSLPRIKDHIDMLAH
jgi:hypothetical protein